MSSAPSRISQGRWAGMALATSEAAGQHPGIESLRQSRMGTLISSWGRAESCCCS
jgi:hypothetical protein